MNHVLRSPAAREDLIDIWCYIAEDSVSAADAMADQFENAFDKLLANPRMGVARDELAEGLRSFVVKSYFVFYRLQDDRIEIVRVLSGYRDIDAIFDEQE